MGSWLALARGGGTGVLNVNGGTLTIAANNLTIGSLTAGTGLVTIGGGMVLGLGAVGAAEFSFLLGLPTLGAACVHDLLGNLHHGGPSMFQLLGVGPVVLGLVVAAVSAMLAVRWLVSFLTRHGLAPFGWYRLVLSGLLAALVFSGALG